MNATAGTPTDRALKILAENMFFTLGTAEDGLPWCSPVAFAAGPGPVLHFYSAAESAHARHITKNQDVAIAAFDSRARGGEVDGLQMEAKAATVELPALQQVTEHYFSYLFKDPELREWWSRPPADFAGDGTWRMYRLDIEAAFVIDSENFEATRIDRRVRVELPALLEGIAALGSDLGLHASS